MAAVDSNSLKLNSVHGKSSPKPDRTPFTPFMGFYLVGSYLFQEKLKLKFYSPRFARLGGGATPPVV